MEISVRERNASSFAARGEWAAGCSFYRSRATGKGTGRRLNAPPPRSCSCCQFRYWTVTARFSVVVPPPVPVAVTMIGTV